MVNKFRPVIGGILLALLAHAAQADVASPIYRVVVEASEASRAVRSEQISTRNTQTALQAALEECENKRQAALIERHCEPTRVDGEAISTAVSLRQRAAEELADSTPGNISLFRVATPTATVHLYGSVHLMKKNAYPLHPAIMEAFRASDKLVLEVNLSAIPPATLQQAFMSKGLYQGSKTLTSGLQKSTVELLDAVLKSRGLSRDAYENMRPWLFEQTLVTQEMQLYGFDSNSGIDSYFDRLARAQGKQVLQLETLEQQLELLSASSLRDQEFSLRYTLDALQKRSVQKELNALVIDWLQGDVDGLFDYMMQPVREYPQLGKFMHAMFDERNIAMTEKIHGWIQQGGQYFVIVGAGHLGGPNGIVSLLKAKGYDVQQQQRL